jgi:hypothetical protein
MRPRFAPRHLLAFGLLLHADNFLLRHLWPMADWTLGLLVGTGLGLELLALYGAARLRTFRC